MADQHNLTPVLARCMDRYLVFPLLEFLSQKALFDGADIQRAKIAAAGAHSRCRRPVSGRLPAAVRGASAAAADQCTHRRSSGPAAGV